MAYKNPETQRKYMKKYQKTHRASVRKACRDYTARKRQAILAFMGGKCVICGFDDWRALQVDHVNGGGTKEWARVNSPARFEMIKANPQNYQLLCANHNWIKKYERDETQRIKS